jgi:hypothetical protein
MGVREWTRGGGSGEELEEELGRRRRRCVDARVASQDKNVKRTEEQSGKYDNMM